MRQVKTVSLIVFLLGLLYVAGAAFCLYQYRGITELFEYYGISYAEQLNSYTIVKMRQMLLGSFMLYSIAALLTLASALGLFHAKEWARKFWLGVVLLLTAFHLVSLAMDLHEAWYILVMKLVEAALVGLVAAVSWRLLTKESLKGVFRRHVASAA